MLILKKHSNAQQYFARKSTKFLRSTYDEESESAKSLQKWKKYVSMGQITENVKK